MKHSSAQIAVPRMTPVVRVVLILSVVLFFVQLLSEQAGIALSPWFGFVPARLLDGWIWQPFSYPFLHAGLFHLLFNLLVIWSIGSELEALWGWRTFLGFFFVCAIGAAICHGLVSLTGIGPGVQHPVIGSSGVVYGLLLAYGILFGERVMYFFLLFPMQARYFVMILGAVELVSSLAYGKDGVSHVAHLGGMLFGFLFLMAMAAWRQRSRAEYQEQKAEKERKKRLKKADHLRLVRGKPNDEDEGGPQSWN
jgi:membrane associated rhomboid family serine protease